jgi:hypothetical protein
MENLKEGDCTSSDLILNVKTKRDVTRFKAGAELSGKVKRDVTVDEDITDEAQEWKITLVLTSERCSK